MTTAALEVGLSYECIRIADARRTGILSDWEKWLRRADELYERFSDRLEGDSPFDYHEVASVGFLSNAAAMAGYLPMNEYDIFKRGRSDKRTKVPGRADLWFDTGPRCYSFEFKRTRRPVTMGYLGQRLEQALLDVKCVDRDESHHAAACLLTVAREPARIETCRRFAASAGIDAAYIIGPSNEPAFLFFRLRS